MKIKTKSAPTYNFAQCYSNYPNLSDRNLNENRLNRFLDKISLTDSVLKWYTNQICWNM